MSISISLVVGIEANVPINSYKIKPLLFELSNAVLQLSFELFEFFERAALLLLQISRESNRKKKRAVDLKVYKDSVLEKEYGK